MRAPWHERWQRLDRRWLFLSLVVVSVIPFIHSPALPLGVFWDTRGLYDVIEASPDDSTVLVIANWGPGSKGESEPQTEAIIEHLFQVGAPFLITGFDVNGPLLTNDIALARAQRYGRRYGEDWANLGFWPYEQAALLSFADDLHSVRPTDYQGTPVAQLPVVAPVRSMRGIYLVVIIGAGGASDYDPWLGLIQPRFRFRGTDLVQVAYAGTGVTGPLAYPFLDTGQLAGLLVGLRGAAEYQGLIGSLSADVERRMWIQSLGHLLLIGLVLAGNLAYFSGRRRRVRA